MLVCIASLILWRTCTMHLRSSCVGIRLCKHVLSYTAIIALASSGVRCTKLVGKVHAMMVGYHRSMSNGAVSRRRSAFQAL